MKEYAAALTEGLPKNGVLLSDDPRRLILMQAWLARAGREKDFLPLDTHIDAQNLGPLAWPAYHRYLGRKYPARWEAMPDPKREQLFNTKELIELATKLAEKSELCYLHPSFGYYFEFFYLEPHGLTYRLKRFGTGTLLPPPLAPELIAENEKVWTKVTDQYLKRVLPVTMPREPGGKLSLIEGCFKAAHLPPEKNAQALNIGALYSRALNEWAVEVQKNGDLEKAGTYFDLAQKLNADNIVAEINHEYNRNLRAGQRTPLQLPKSVEDRFGKYRTWEQVLGENGPYDEPGFCYAQGYTFMRGGYYRQAAQSFDRVRALSPTDAASRIWLAQLNLMARLPDKTLELTQEIRDHRERFTLSSTNRNELLALEARAHYARNEPGKAVQILEAALKQSPNDEHLLAAATGVYFQNGQYSNALAAVNRHLKLAPDIPALLVSKGAFCMQVNAFDQAIQSLTRALALETNNYTAQFYRAISYLRSGQLEAAQNDYEMVQRAFPTTYQVYYGLGEIAYRRKDTNTAIRYYEAYLTNSVPIEEGKFVSQRLKELKGEQP
jgi:tetratricopeptide (TPR) repeat protein